MVYEVVITFRSETKRTFTFNLQHLKANYNVGSVFQQQIMGCLLLR